jgi:hypothetical protein
MTWTMDFVAGVVYAAIFVATVRTTKRLQNPVLAIAILGAAVPYVAIGLRTNAASALTLEIAGVGLFAALAALGVWVSPGYLALAWAIHAAWDLVIPLLTDTNYMPTWYAAVCVGFDCVVSLYLVSVIRGWIPAVGFGRSRS